MRTTFLAFLGLLACNGDDPSSTKGDDDDDVVTTSTADTATNTVGDALSVTTAPSPHVPSVLHITLSEPLTGTAIVHFGSDLSESTPPQPLANSQLIPWIGAVAGRTYPYQVEVILPDGTSRRSAELSVTAPVAPLGLDSITVVTTMPSATAGYVGVSAIGPNASYAIIMNSAGELVWWKQAALTEIIITPMMSLDGLSVMWGEYDQGKEDDTGTFYRVPLAGTEIGSKRLDRSHHAAVELPDGNVAWLAFDFRDVETSDGQIRRMATDRIFEAPEVGSDPYVERFNTFDDHPGPPTLTCEHMTGDFDRFEEKNILEWTHGNSLAYVESEDAFYLNAKQTDWLLKIDRTTGTLLWQLGGIGTGFTWNGGAPAWTSAYEPTLFSHAHMSHVWEGGMVTFDNGDHRTPRVSSAAELSWDDDALTAERVWEFYHPEGRNTYALGDVKKLDSGNYLIAWGELAEVMEVTPAHEVIWQVDLPTSFTLGRTFHLDSLYGPTE